MKLPNRRAAEVPKRKVTHYLLSFEHPTGRFKAKFFTAFGFARDEWQILAQALRNHANANEATSVQKSEFGTKYAVDGPLVSPDRRNPKTRSIWFIEKGQARPRFVTAHPLKRSQR